MKFYQENDLWQSLQNENNPIKQRLIMVEMVKLLLEKNAISQSEITLYDCDELTDLFLKYQDSGKYIVDFFNTTLPHLDPEYKGQPFETELKQFHEQLANKVKDSERIRHQVNQLADEEKRLKTEIADLEKLSSEADALKCNVEQLTKHKTELLQVVEQFDKINLTSQVVYAEIRESFMTTIEKTNELLKESYNIQKAHHNENQKVKEAFNQVSQADNLPDISENLLEINNLNRNIDNQLKNFDQMLAKLIQLMENHTQLARSQRTKV